jgi:hypothetical protein
LIPWSVSLSTFSNLLPSVRKRIRFKYLSSHTGIKLFPQPNWIEIDQFSIPWLEKQERGEILSLSLRLSEMWNFSESATTYLTRWESDQGSMIENVSKVDNNKAMPTQLQSDRIVWFRSSRNRTDDYGWYLWC